MLLFESICKGHLRHWFIRNFSKLQDIDTLCYVAVNKEIGFSDIIISLVSRTARTAVKGYCNDGLVRWRTREFSSRWEKYWENIAIESKY